MYRISFHLYALASPFNQSCSDSRFQDVQLDPWTSNFYSGYVASSTLLSSFTLHVQFMCLPFHLCYWYLCLVLCTTRLTMLLLWYYTKPRPELPFTLKNLRSSPIQQFFNQFQNSLSPERALEIQNGEPIYSKYQFSERRKVNNLKPHWAEVYSILNSNAAHN